MYANLVFPNQLNLIQTNKQTPPNKRILNLPEEYGSTVQYVPLPGHKVQSSKEENEEKVFIIVFENSYIQLTL